MLVTSLSGYQSVASDIPITVTIRGIEPGDKATLSLTSMAPNGDAIFEQTVVGEEKGEVTITVDQDLKDGNYELALTAPEKYFRDPKAYWFTVYQTNIVNPGNKPIIFNLIPPSTQKYLPYRNLSSNTSMDAVKSTSQPTHQVEGTISLSGPPKQYGAGYSILTPSYYHYAGPETTFDNDGVWGRFAVTNPSVNHSLSNPEYQFVVDRVMARKDIYSDPYTFQRHWMEIGWVEGSWLSDTRYMYHYDSTDNTWYTYSLPTGTTLEVRVVSQGSNVWATEYFDGYDWVAVRSNNISFSTADFGENLVEVYTYTSNDDHPNVPSTATDYGALCSSGSWSNWTTYYSTSTYNDSPYDTHYTTQYYDFYVHKN